MLCFSQLSIASELEEKASNRDIFNYIKHAGLSPIRNNPGCFRFGNLIIDQKNSDQCHVSRIFGLIICNQNKLDKQVLSQDSDIKLFVENINLILELEKFTEEKKASVGLLNRQEILFFGQLLKDSYLEQLKNSHEFLK